MFLFVRNTYLWKLISIDTFTWYPLFFDSAHFLIRLAITIMKLFVAATLAASATAFAPVAFTGRQSTAIDAGIGATLMSLQGPEIFWGAEGVAVGKEESDIKGYDNFTKLVAACQANGINLDSGEYTLLAPSDSAFEKHASEVGTPITADILQYHVIPGRKSMDALTTDQPTLQGGTLTAYRKFRKNWLDFAIIGLKSEGASMSANWPADVVCDNGYIHAIDTVLVPGAYTGSR